MKIVTVQDVSCYGGCSASIALPVLSSYGVETAFLPTAILSTNTSFKNAIKYNLIDELKKITKHWIDEKLEFDGIYTGYISDYNQFDVIFTLKEKLLRKNGLLFVDPAMADNGKLYEGLDLKIIDGMRRLCSIADYIFPNITEACMLTNQKYQDNISVDLLLEKLIALGAKNIILTSINNENKIGATFYDGKRRITILKNKEEKSYCGLGDVFTSVVIGNICSGIDIETAIDKACEFVIKVIKNTINDLDSTKCIKFESVLNLSK